MKTSFFCNESQKLDFTNGENLNQSKCVFLCGCALWLITHPYWGIWHDARVYTLMGLQWINPAAFIRDPWFAFGSQDAYSLFSPCFGTMIVYLGVQQAALLGTMIEGALYIYACWYMSQRLLLRSANSLIFLLLVSVQLKYCINDYRMLETFRISENFITSRNIALALSITALAALMNQRKIWSFLLLLVGMLMHPLMAAWASILYISKILQLRTKNLVILCLLGFYSIALLCWFDIGIFKQMSDDWAETVQAVSVIVFPNYLTQVVDFYLACYGLLFFAGRLGSQKLRSWYQHVFIISASATMLYLFCSAYAPSALIMQLQLWRSNWLTVFFAVIAFVDLSKKAFLGSKQYRFIFLIAILPGLYSWWISAICLFVCGAYPIHFLKWAKGVIGRKPTRSWYCLVGYGILFLVYWIVHSLKQIQIMGNFLNPSSYGWGSTYHELWDTPPFFSSSLPVDLLKGLCFSGGFGLLAFIVWRLLYSQYKAVATFAILVFTSIIVPRSWVMPGGYKESSAGTIAMPVDYRGYSEFKKFVRPGSVVYWQERPFAIYFSLQTASYVNKMSLIGVVFSEKKNDEVIRRLQRVALAGETNELINSQVPLKTKIITAHKRQKDRKFDITRVSTYEVDELSRPGLKYICSDPELDFVIHDSQFEDLALASEMDEVGERKTWYLYSCADVRISPKATAAE